MLYPLLRHLLFTLPPETAHHVTLSLLTMAERLGVSTVLPMPKAPCRVWGLDFPNPVGLAAGLDKNGDCIKGLAALGFGFIEIGTVTPRPQLGNAKPRLFRLPQHQALINRMGFNNAGLDHLVRQVERARYDGILGINIGKNFDTPVECAVDDYRHCLQRVYDYAQYIVINISSPNTPGLRTLQYGDVLKALLSELKNTQQQLAGQYGKSVPLLVKIAPDLSGEAVDVIAEQLLDCQMDGVIATNTTQDRTAVEGHRYAAESGGLSGAPLLKSSQAVLQRLALVLEGKLPIVGVGGITEGLDAAAKIQAGASLVQVYSGFIYQGPRLIREAVAAIQNQALE